MPKVMEPKLLSVLREGYPLSDFLKDLQAGIIVGLVALPLAIAFAIASGVAPDKGLVTAVVAGLIISAFGGSRFQIGGPTGAFIVIVYAIVQRHGYDGLAAATLLAGVMLIAMGLTGMGGLIKFIPYPVTVGFTSGIAVLIAASQGRDALGLRMEAVPSEFLEKLAAYGHVIGTGEPWAAAVCALCAALILLWPKVTRRVPGALAALLLSTAAVALFDLPVETIGSRFPPLPAGLPAPRLPSLSLDLLKSVFQPAVTIALLAAIESLLSAVVADGMTGRRHRSDMELVAQGLANIASPLFGGIPATGAIARTATNIKNGARTPVAGIVHAATLLIVLLFAGRWALMIPMPALAGILLVVAYHMSEWRHFVRLLRAPRSDVAVLLTTFLLTVLVDLTVAVQTGMVMAAFLFMRRMAAVTEFHLAGDMGDEEEDPDDPMSLKRKSVPPGVEVFEINGPFFFGAAEQFKDTLRRVSDPPKVLILRMRRVPAIDATGLYALEDLAEKAMREKTRLVFSGVRPRPRAALEKIGLIEKIGKENVLPNIDRALERAREMLGDGVS